MINYSSRVATARAGVLGATGYTGRELVRLLVSHPELRLAFATSETTPQLRLGGLHVDLVDAEEAAEIEADLVFCCLPSGRSEGAAQRLVGQGVRVIDFSADLRPPTGPGVYGLPELYREPVREAKLVANPGCYPTGVLLALAPLLRLELVDAASPIVVDAASGVTGAGRTPKPDLLFAEVAEDYRVYGLGNEHRHMPEMRWAIEGFAGGAVPLVFTPHLLPIRRGILETIYLPVQPGVSSVDVHAAWTAAYGVERFVEVFHDRAPSLADAVGRNAVCLHACDVRGLSHSMVQLIVALDNLLKGASGQALQNANLMLGFEETLGIPR